MRDGSLPTYNRQRYLLSILNQAEDPLAAISIQKLVFINEQESEINYYDFVPYRYGPYSFLLANDLEILCTNKFVKKENNRYTPLCSIPFQFLFPIAKERGKDLIRRAYREYPYYAINSEILNDLFSKEELRSYLQERKKYHNDHEMLYTIGYEGRSLESFINTLIQNDVKMVCDVRKNPLSRKFGFSKNTLSHILPVVGIEYINIQELGIDSEKRTDLKCKRDYEILFQEYKNNLPNRELFVKKVFDLYKQHRRIALMCYEKEPEMCHRHVIRDYLERNYEGIYSLDM